MSTLVFSAYVHNIDLTRIRFVPKRQDLKLLEAEAEIESVSSVVVLVHSHFHGLYLHKAVALGGGKGTCRIEQLPAGSAAVELLFYAHYCKLYGIASCLLETEKADRLAVVICCKKRLLGTLFNIALAALLYLEPFCQTFEYEPRNNAHVS